MHEQYYRYISYNINIKNHNIWRAICLSCSFSLGFSFVIDNEVRFFLVVVVVVNKKKVYTQIDCISRTKKTSIKTSNIYTHIPIYTRIYTKSNWLWNKKKLTDICNHTNNIFCRHGHIEDGFSFHFFFCLFSIFMFSLLLLWCVPL